MYIQYKALERQRQLSEVVAAATGTGLCMLYRDEVINQTGSGRCYAHLASGSLDFIPFRECSYGQGSRPAKTCEDSARFEREDDLQFC